ncbi:MAG TPA: hypothetical protein VK826_04400 [Bacteroidia bacterium]|nr:hypothetical protein [Bacteroidia bacterium]
MKPEKKVALIAFALSLQGLIPYLANERSKLPLLSLVWIILSALLWKQSKTAFRVFRFLIWFIFIVILFMELVIVFSISNSYPQWFVGSWGATVAWYVLLLVGLGAILYYTETDKVRLAFGLLPKSSQKKIISEEA